MKITIRINPNTDFEFPPTIGDTARVQVEYTQIPVELRDKKINHSTVIAEGRVVSIEE